MGKTTHSAAGRARAAMALVATAGLAFLTSCGYHLVGSGKGAFPEVKTLRVPPFENNTGKIELGQRITEQVVEELARRGGYRITSAPGADATLQGKILEYRRTPVAFDAEGRANRYEVAVQVQVTLVTGAGDTLYTSQDYLFRETYDRVEDPSRFFDQEILAYDVIAEDLARTLVSNILDAY